MPRLLRIFLFTAYAIAITTMQIVHATILNYPASLLNIVFLSLIIVLFVFETPAVAPLSLFIFFIIDLYSVLTPFGIVLFSGTISMILGLWLHRDVFTNRSWLAAIGVTFLTLLCYRGLYVVLTLVTTLLGGTLSIIWSRVLVSLAWEICLTSVAVGIIVFVLSFFMSNLRLGAIEQKLTWIE